MPATIRIPLFGMIRASSQLLLSRRWRWLPMDKFLNSGDGWPRASHSPLLPGWLRWTRKRHVRIATTSDYLHNEKRHATTARGSIPLPRSGTTSSNCSRLNLGSRRRPCSMISGDSITVSSKTPPVGHSNAALPIGGQSKDPTKRSSFPRTITLEGLQPAISPSATPWASRSPEPFSNTPCFTAS